MVEEAIKAEAPNTYAEAAVMKAAEGETPTERAHRMAMWFLNKMVSRNIGMQHVERDAFTYHLALLLKLGYHEAETYRENCTGAQEAGTRLWNKIIELQGQIDFLKEESAAWKAWRREHIVEYMTKHPDLAVRALSDAQGVIEAERDLARTERDQARAELAQLKNPPHRGDCEHGNCNECMLQHELEEARAERDALLGDRTPWPLRDVLLRLGGAVEHLLDDHDCDGHGHEETRRVAIEARALVAKLDVLRNAKSDKEG